jgi:membrane protein
VSDGVVSHGKDLAHELARSRPMRTWQRYGAALGSVLAGGIAYSGLFSVFSALLVGFTVLGLVVGSSSDLQEPVLRAVNDQLPGLLDLGDGGLVQPEALFASDVLSFTGAVALVVALWSGLGWLDATRSSIRAVFGLQPDDRSLVRKKVQDVGILATLGLAILASALLSVVVNAVAGPLLDAVGLGSGWLGTAVLRLLGVLVVLAVDTGVLVILLRLLSRVPLTWRQVRTGALVGAAGLGLLKLLGGLLLGRVGGGNPLLATSAVLVGLLLWMNLVSRVVLLAAAWVATEEDVKAQVAAAPGRRPSKHVPVPAGPRDLMRPSFGQRSAARTTLAAGAVLGALGAYGVRGLSSAGRALVDAARGRQADGPG